MFRLTLLLPSIGTVQKLVNSGAELVRPIQLKMKLGGTAKVQVLCHFATNESDGRGQSLQRPFRFFVISIERYEDSRRARILGEHHAGDADQPNARVAKLAFDDGFDFLSQGFSEPFPMIFACALLHGFPSE
jgi:hypothetical protein